jgi:hypothetical protein
LALGSALLVLDEGGQLDWEARRHLAAIMIVLSWSEFLILVGQHPSLSTNVTMLFTVVSTFFRFLLWYTLFIVAFAFSFYIMFHTDHPGFSNIFSSSFLQWTNCNLSIREQISFKSFTEYLFQKSCA